ncbi:PAS domain S-box protein [Saliphagus sp. GCM10025317]
MNDSSELISVLHVDDDPHFADLASTFLERTDPQLDVVSASNPPDGLQLLAESRIDCVVSDYDMPHTNGIEFLERLRRDHPELPFILYTGKGSEEIASDAISAGVTDYLQKERGTSQYAVLANRIRNAVEQSRAKRATRESQTKLTQIAAKADDVLYMFSADWTDLLFVNSAYEDLWGDSIEALEADPKRFLERIHPDDRDRVREVMQTVSEGRSETIEYRVVVDGERRWVRADSKPILDSTGEPDRIVGFVRNITAQKRREDQLRSSRARLEALFENSPDMIAVHDAEGRIRDVNDRFAEALGYAAADLVGLPVWEIDTTVEPDQARAFWSGLPTNDPRRFEAELQRRDGTTFPVEVHLIRLDLDGKDRFVAMDRDISDQKIRERELLRQNERLDRFASVVSHDLRNPLQVAQGRLELLGADCESDHLADLDAALERMNALVDDLLTLAHEGGAAVDLEAVDLTDLAEACWATVRTEAAILDADSAPAVRANRQQLRQLLENLFRNAVEHGGDAVTVTVGGLENGFYVADDGRGIPDGERESVFESGYSTSTEGTGYGLSIVDRIADLHEWERRVVESSAGGVRIDVSNVETC